SFAAGHRADPPQARSGDIAARVAGEVRSGRRHRTRPARSQVRQRDCAGVLSQAGLPADGHDHRLLPRCGGRGAAGKESHGRVRRSGTRPLSLVTCVARRPPGREDGRACDRLLPYSLYWPAASCAAPLRADRPGLSIKDLQADPMAVLRLPRILLLPVLAGIAFLLISCGQSGSAPSAPGPGGGGGGMPPPEVGVVTVAPGEVGLVTELPGRLEASRVAQVRARAAGIVQQRLFREGSDVRAGQPLFRIDPAPYAAASASAQANLARAQANLGQATSLAERYKPLVEANAVSKQDYANAVAGQKQAEAEVAAARA